MIPCKDCNIFKKFNYCPYLKDRLIYSQWWKRFICVFHTLFIKVAPEVYDDVGLVGWGYVLDSWWTTICTPFRHIKWFFQRVFRGWDNRNLWALDCSIVKWLLPQLIAFRNLPPHGHPCDLKCMEDWLYIIDKMIWSFKWILADSEDKYADEIGYSEMMDLFNKAYNLDMDNNKTFLQVKDEQIKNRYESMKEELEDKYQEGMNLFYEYFRNLWD